MAPSSASACCFARAPAAPCWPTISRCGWPPCARRARAACRCTRTPANCTSQFITPPIASAGAAPTSAPHGRLIARTPPITAARSTPTGAARSTTRRRNWPAPTGRRWPRRSRPTWRCRTRQSRRRRSTRSRPTRPTGPDCPRCRSTARRRCRTSSCACSATPRHALPTIPTARTSTASCSTLAMRRRPTCWRGDGGWICG